MEWCKLYANLYHQPEVQAAEDAVDGAGWLLGCAIMYCTETETGGFVPDTQIRRFGLANLDAKVKVLAAEGCWLREDRGYRLNPDLWSEERNLSDSAERKKEADRLRMRAKRARERDGQAGQESRDRRATGRATVSRDSSGDSRTVEERREEQNRTPPTPPRRKRPTPPPGPPLLNLAVSPGGGDKPGGQDNQSHALDDLVAEVQQKHRPDWPAEKIRRALRAVEGRPWTLVQAAMLAVAADPASDKPWRVTQDGPWWQPPPDQRRGVSSPAPRPGHCGQCDPLTRLTLDDQPRRCPACHPLRDEAQAAS